MVQERTHGRMGDSTSGNGKTENNMEMEVTDNQMDKKEKEYGKMERELNGMTNEQQHFHYTTIYINLDGYESIYYVHYYFFINYTLTLKILFIR